MTKVSINKHLFFSGILLFIMLSTLAILSWYAEIGKKEKVVARTRTTITDNACKMQFTGTESYSASSATYTLTLTMKNLSSTTANVNLEPVACRCFPGKGYNDGGGPSDYCQGYEPQYPHEPGISGPMGLGNCQSLGRVTRTVSGYGTSTHTVSVTQYKNLACGSYQLDYRLYDVNGTSCDYQLATYGVYTTSRDIGGTSCAIPTVVPTAVPQKPIQVTFSLWNAAIRNISTTAQTVQFWSDCYQSYQSNCPPDDKTSLSIQPGQTVNRGPGGSFCFEGQINVGSSPDGNEYGSKKFLTSTIPAAIGVNNNCTGPTPLPTTPPLVTPTPRPDRVTGYTLINADTDTDIGSLNNGDTLDLSTLPTRNLNIRANTNPATVGSVEFGYDADPSYKTDNNAPYALGGNSGSDYNPWTPTLGTHTLQATPYEDSNAGGTAGAALTITFNVVDNTPTFSISGNVYIDTNANGSKDSGETNYQGANITVYDTSDNVRLYDQTDINGNYAIANQNAGSYTVTLSAPTGYKATTRNPRNATLGPNATVNFGIVQAYTISGNVIKDDNKNGLKDGTETNYEGNIRITANSGNVLYQGDGEFEVVGLTAGIYTISYTSLPTDYQIVYPKNGPPPFFSVRVGAGCTVNAAQGASCTAANDITNLNFAISNSFPWVQSAGLDVRFDNGYDNPIPNSPNCSTSGYGSIAGSGTTPGIIYVGDTAPKFGRGQASERNWVVGGSAYPEVYKTKRTALSSSYASTVSTMQRSGTPIVNIQSVGSCSNLSNCTLPNNLPSGVYQAQGNLTLNSYSFQNNRNFTILVNGTLTIRGTIRVPNGTTALFSAANDIVVSPTVGSVPSCVAASGDIEGIFSADDNFIVQGTNDCSIGADRMLQIKGTVLVNAALQGGTFQNMRDLCAANLQYPTILFAERPDFLLNIPDYMRRKNFIYQEVAP